jgi:hypothetical protein
MTLMPGGGGGGGGGPSNLIYGLDNWIYGTVGYAGFQGTVAGESFRFGQGIYRFRLERNPTNPKAPPRVSQFEFLRSTTNNTWGWTGNL